MAIVYDGATLVRASLRLNRLQGTRLNRNSIIFFGLYRKMVSLLPDVHLRLEKCVFEMWGCKLYPADT